MHVCIPISEEEETPSFSYLCTKSYFLRRIKGGVFWQGIWVELGAMFWNPELAWSLQYCFWYYKERQPLFEQHATSGHNKKNQQNSISFQSPEYLDPTCCENHTGTFLSSHSSLDFATHKSLGKVLWSPPHILTPPPKKKLCHKMKGLSLLWFKFSGEDVLS